MYVCVCVGGCLSVYGILCRPFQASEVVPKLVAVVWPLAKSVHSYSPQKEWNIGPLKMTQLLL